MVRQMIISALLVEARQRLKFHIYPRTTQRMGHPITLRATPLRLHRHHPIVSNLSMKARMGAHSLLHLSIRTLTVTILTLGNMAMAHLNMDKMHNLHLPRTFTLRDQVVESAATYAVTLFLMKRLQQDAKKMIALPSTKDAPRKFKKLMGEWAKPRV